MVGQHRLLFAFAVAATIGTINPTIAQDTDGAAAGEAAYGYERLAFDAADTDGDGFGQALVIAHEPLAP